MNKEAIIIAGANGTGKTTFARDFATRYPFKFINADEIAKSINPQNFNQAKLEAGKLFFRHIRKAMEAGESVIIESTLGSQSKFGCNDKKLFDIFIKGVEEK